MSGGSQQQLQGTKADGGRGLKAVDQTLVDSLVEYTTNDPECSDAMRAYIRGLIDQGNKNPEDTKKSLDMGLRSNDLHALGIGPRLKAYLQGYALSTELFQSTNPSSASSQPTGEKVHWSDKVSQKFGAPAAEGKQAVGLDGSRHPEITAEQQKSIDMIVRIMIENIERTYNRPKEYYMPSTLPSVAAHSHPILRSSTQLDPVKMAFNNLQNKMTSNTIPATTAAATSTAALTTGQPRMTPDIARDLKNMQFKFDPASGLVLVKPPPGTGKGQAAALRLSHDGATTRPVRFAPVGNNGATSPRTSGQTPSGIAQGKQSRQQSTTGVPQLPRLKALPTQPAIGGTFWSMYKSLAKTDPKAAAAFLKLVEIRLQDYLQNTPEGKMALRGIIGTAIGPDHIVPLLEPRDTPDWMQDSWYRGTRQPPLGVRLENILNFLRDEDVDRCMDFESRYKEIGYYLNWLWEVDDLEQLQNASPATKRLFYDAVSKLLVHKNFEAHHYTPSQLPNGPPPTVPQQSTRLDWTNANKNLVLTNTEGIKPVNNRKAYSRPVFPRPGETVNTMLDEETEGITSQEDKEKRQNEIFEPFSDAANEFWSAERKVQLAGRIDDNDTNLAVVESRAYNDFISVMTAWVLGGKRDHTGMRYLPDDTLILQDHPESWAKERGARRAGMNQLLQSFRSVEQMLAGPQRSLVALPLRPEVELRLKAKADGLQWKPPHVPASRLPPQLETMPYTYWWNIYTQELGWLRYQAMLECQRKYVKARRWVTLPTNLIWSGPFVWRQIDPDVQTQQDLLEQVETTVKMLQLASTREPRELLTAVMTYVNRGLEGEFVNGQPPAELRLRDDEWYKIGEVPQAKFTSSQDIKWLQYLATDCANVKNCKGPSDQYTGADHQLYQMFTKRVKKLLADRSAYSLFRDYATGVKVEPLLERMNAGADGQVKKLTFKPYQACFFLDRMAEEGFIRFKPDLEWYGVVHRPEIELAPEHRVRWPDKRNSSKVQIPYFPYDLVTYDSMVGPRLVPRDVQDNLLMEDGEPKVRVEEKVILAPNTELHSRHYRFFTNLGFRLGWTMWQLTHERRRWVAPNLQPVPTQVLRDTVKLFDDTAIATGQSQKELRRQTRSREDMITNVQEVVQRANAFDWNDKMTRAEAIQIIRDRIAAEGEANLGLLAPARRKEYYQDGETKVAYVHDISWEWAGVRVRGWRRNFWDMDRWAPHDDYLTTKSKETRAKDGILDWAQCHNPFSCDKTPQKWKRPKLRRFGEDDKTTFKPGPAIYPIGDTKAQREAVEDYITNLAARAMGINQHKRTWSDSFARLNPFSSFSSPPSKPPGRRDGDAWLPKVDRKSLPVSFDPEGFLEDLEWNRQQQEAARLQAQGNEPDDMATPEAPASGSARRRRGARLSPVARRKVQHDLSDDDGSVSSTDQSQSEIIEVVEEMPRPAKRFRAEDQPSIMSRGFGKM